MLFSKVHKVRDSIGYKLFKVVFSFYVLIAIVVTTIHIYSEYDHAKKEVYSDMANVELSFKKQLASSVWTLDNKLITEISQGIILTRTIIGITLKDEKENLILNSGIVETKNRSDRDENVNYKDELYIHQFDIYPPEVSPNETEKIGTVYLYSDDNVIFTSVKNNFTLIILNSFIKTFALWILFLFFSRKYITQPLYEIINTTSSIDFDNPKKMNIDSKFHNNSEFKILVDEFNHMIQKLSTTYKDLKVANNDNIELNKTLEEKVQRRTEELEASNEELEQIIISLEETREKLIQSEKMASLSRVVTGIAHEINTPVGTCITGTSFIKANIKELERKHNEGEMTQEEFEEFIKTSKKISQTVSKNLNTISKLVQNFKEIVAERNQEKVKEFKIHENIEFSLLTIQDQIPKNINVIINCSKSLVVNTYPNAIAQIIPKLVINSIYHGYKDGEDGKVIITVTKEEKQTTILYKDHGKGIKKEHLDKIFDPFFTTQRTHGETGLGLNAVYNIVTTQLGGDIKCKSIEGEGVEFKVEFFDLNS